MTHNSVLSISHAIFIIFHFFYSISNSDMFHFVISRQRKKRDTKNNRDFLLFFFSPYICYIFQYSNWIYSRFSSISTLESWTISTRSKQTATRNWIFLSHTRLGYFFFFSIPLQLYVVSHYTFWAIRSRQWEIKISLRTKLKEQCRMIWCYWIDNERDRVTPVTYRFPDLKADKKYSNFGYEKK